MPGCGKSTLGRLLAKRLDKPFYDADVELERALGVTIPVIFELEGEPGFRDREEAVLAELVARSNIVLSTGGGVVLRPSNRERLKRNGTVLYLHAAPPTLWERTRHSKHRPLLQAPDPFTRVQELYAMRDSLYREVADAVVESDREQLSRLAHRLELQLRAAARA
jgi:shikimate kinase